MSKKETVTWKAFTVQCKQKTCLTDYNLNVRHCNRLYRVVSQESMNDGFQCIHHTRFMNIRDLCLDWMCDTVPCVPISVTLFLYHILVWKSLFATWTLIYHIYELYLKF